MGNAEGAEPLGVAALCGPGPRAATTGAGPSAAVKGLPGAWWRQVRCVRSFRNHPFKKNSGVFPFKLPKTGANISKHIVGADQPRTIHM